MLPLIEQHRDEITQLCQRFHVKRLDLFGSAASGDFNPDKSDLDFFVEFLEYGRSDAADNWFGLEEELKKLFQRKVDLVSIRMVRNPYFLRMANEHRVSLYAA